MKSDEKEVKMELRGENEVVFTRTFAAPRQVVFDCLTKPELMRRWLIGPEGMVLETCEQDLRIGGRYLYLYADAKGNKSGVYGKFLDVKAPEKVANTENYIMDYSIFNPNAPEDPNATVESRTLTAEGKGTLMTHVCRYPSAEVRQMIAGSGADEGMAACYRELDKLLLEGVNR